MGQRNLSLMIASPMWILIAGPYEGFYSRGGSSYIELCDNIIKSA